MPTPRPQHDTRLVPETLVDAPVQRIAREDDLAMLMRRLRMSRTKGVGAGVSFPEPTPVRSCEVPARVG